MTPSELKRLMNRRGLTCVQLAARTAYHPSTIKRFRAGIRPINRRAARLMRSELRRARPCEGP